MRINRQLEITLCVVPGLFSPTPLKHRFCKEWIWARSEVLVLLDRIVVSVCHGFAP